MCKCEYNIIKKSYSREMYIKHKRNAKWKEKYNKNDNNFSSQKNAVIFTEQSVYDNNEIRGKMEVGKIISICMQINEYIKKNVKNGKYFHSKDIRNDTHEELHGI